MSLSENKILALLTLIKNGKITSEDIKDLTYKQEVENRLAQQ